MSGIPPRRTQRFYEKKAIVEAIAMVPPIAMAAVTAAINFRDPTKRLFGSLIIAAIVWLFLASVVRVLNARTQDKGQKRREEYDGLLGALHVIYGMVSKRAGIEDNSGNLRTTLHRVVPPAEDGASAEELEQLLPYVGGRGNGPGRTFSIRSGVIGKAVREKNAFAASRQSDDYEKFLSELVREWSYTDQDARKLTPDRRAWMAVPIFSPKMTVAAVVYLDSSEKDFFTAELQQLIIEACSGVASYINEVYK